MLLPSSAVPSFRKRKVRSTNKAVVVQPPLTQRFGENAPPQQSSLTILLQKLDNRRRTELPPSQYQCWVPPTSRKEVLRTTTVNEERLWTVNDSEPYNFVSSRHLHRLKAEQPKPQPSYSRSARILEYIGSYEVTGWQNDG